MSSTHEQPDTSDDLYHPGRWIALTVLVLAVLLALVPLEAAIEIRATRGRSD